MFLSNHTPKNLKIIIQKFKKWQHKTESSEIYKIYKISSEIYKIYMKSRPLSSTVESGLK